MKQNTLVFEESIRNIMLRIGLFFDDVSVDDNIQNILTESIIFITFIIELEQEFSIEIPDDYLIPERIGTLRQLDNILLELIPQKEDFSGWQLVKQQITKPFKNLWDLLFCRQEKKIKKTK